MDEEVKEGDERDDGENEDIIPSSQGEVFSSQSSTPDLLSSSHVIKILQPSQSQPTGVSAEWPSPHQPRTEELLASTPSTSRIEAGLSSVGDRLDPLEEGCEPLATPYELADMSTTPSEVQLDFTPPAIAAPQKRLRSEDELSPAPDKRLRAAAPPADDSDIQIVEEVEPDVQMVFSTEGRGPALPHSSAAAESQTGFRLSLSPTQSEEVTTVTASSPPAEELAEPSSDPRASRTGSQGLQLPHIQTPQLTASGDSASPPGTVFGHAQRLIEEQNRRHGQPTVPLRSEQSPPVPERVETPAAVAGQAETPAPTAEKAVGEVLATAQTDELSQAKKQEEGPLPVTNQADESVPVTEGEGKSLPFVREPEEAASDVEEVEGPVQTEKSHPTSEQAVEAGPATGQEKLGSVVGQTEKSGLATSKVEESKEMEEPMSPREEQGVGKAAAPDTQGQDAPLSQISDFSLAADWRSVMKSPGHTTEALADPAPPAAGGTSPPEPGLEPAAHTQEPDRLHGTQSPETQPNRPRPPLIKSMSALAKKFSDDGFSPASVQITWTKDGEEPVVRTFPLDERDGVAFLRCLSSLSSSSSSALSGSTSTGGYGADVSTSSKSSGGSQPASKRQSTFSSVTLSTIEGRGARHSISSSVDALLAPGRRSVVSVQPQSPGSEGELQVLSPSGDRPVVPVFAAPHGGRPRPHGQPAAVSSLRAESSPPAAGSQGSGGSHVTGSSGSSELAVAPPLPDAAHCRPLTDSEEDQLSEKEQSALARRTLEPGMLCFALWGADQTYYPGKLVAEGRAGRWLVRFDDGTERQVPYEHVLPVINLWKGLSVFVQLNMRNVYEAGIITGHRMSSEEGPLEYIVSLDSHPNVTSAVPRSWLSLTRDQAQLIRERRQPSLGQLAVGSPSRHLSLDNLVTGRRRAAGAKGSRRLPTFETSCSDADVHPAQVPALKSQGTDSTSASSRRGGSKRNAAPGDRGARERPTTPPRPRAGGDSTPPGDASEAAVAPATPRGRGRKRAKGTPAARGDSIPADDAGEAAAAPATPRGRGRKRAMGTPAARSDSTPADDAGEAAVVPATPRCCGRKRAAGTPTAKGDSTPADDAREATVAPATPRGRGRKRTTGTPRGSGRRRVTASTPTDEAGGRSEEPAPTVSRTGRSSPDVQASDTDPDQTAVWRPLPELPDTPTTLLAGHTFILSCVNTADTTATHRSSRTKRGISAPFNKQQAAALIAAHGGHVLEEATLSRTALQRTRKRAQLLLISNGPLRTAKYVTCLAMGVPCVTIDWLTLSIRQGQCQAYEDYLLPAGRHPETGEQLDQRLGEPPPLQGLRVLVAAEPDSEWAQHMAQILAAAGAKVKQDDQDPAAAAEPVPLDVVVAPPASCPPVVLDWAHSCRTPVVSGEWVVGSVVAHQKLPFTARPEFDFRSSERK